MADILIKGLKLPEGANELRLIIHPNGQVLIVKQTYWEETEAIEISAHGRLIDADELRSEYKEPMDWLDRTQVMYHVTEIWASIDAAPTIIPAEPPKEES